MEENVDMNQHLLRNGDDDEIICTSSKKKEILPLEIAIEKNNIKEDQLINIRKKNNNELTIKKHITRREIIIWKNIIMTIVLLSIPVINFGIFSFPYIALGLVRLFFSLNYKTELQNIFEIIPFGYSLMIGLICKLVLHLNYKENQSSSIIKLLGISSDYFFTFGNDFIVFIASILSMIVEIIFINKDCNKHLYYSKHSIRNVLWILLIAVIGFNCAYTSIASLIIVIIIQIILIFFIKLKRNITLLKGICYFIFFALLSLYGGMTFVNAANIESLKMDEFLAKEIGIFSIKNINDPYYSYILYYVFLSVCLALVGLVIKRINQYQHREKRRKEKKQSSTIVEYIVLNIGRIMIVCWISYYHILLSIILFILFWVSCIELQSKKIIIYLNSIILFTDFVYVNIISFVSLNTKDNQNEKESYFVYLIIPLTNYLEKFALYCIPLPFIYIVLNNISNKKIWNENPIEDIQPIEKDKYFILENREKKQPQENEQEENPKRTLFKKLILKYLIFLLNYVDYAFLLFIVLERTCLVRFSCVILFFVYNYKFRFSKKYLLHASSIIKFLDTIAGLMIPVFITNESNYFSILFGYEKDKELLIFNELIGYCAIYWFYLHDKILNSVYVQQNINIKEISISNLFLLFNNNKESSYFKTTQYYLLHLTFWFVCFINLYALCNFEHTLMFCIHSTIVLRLIFIFFNYITISENSFDDKGFTKKVNYISIWFSMLNTSIVYFLQIFKSNYNTFYQEYEDSHKQLKNLSIVGFTAYKEKSAQKMLAFFVINILTFTLHHLNKMNKKINDERKRIKMSEKREKEEEQLKPKNQLDDIQEYYDNKKLIPKIKKQIIFLSLLQYLLQFGWILFFLFGCVYINNFALSLLSVIDLLILAIFFIKLFGKRIEKLTNYHNQNESSSIKFYNQIRYNLVESPKAFQDKISACIFCIKKLLIIGIVYFCLSYFYGIFDLIQNGDENDTTLPHKHIIEENYEDYLQGICYIIGIYMNFAHYSLFQLYYIYIIIFSIASYYLISFQDYLQNVINEKELILSQKKISNKEIDKEQNNNNSVGCINNNQEDEDNQEEVEINNVENREEENENNNVENKEESHLPFKYKFFQLNNDKNDQKEHNLYYNFKIMMTKPKIECKLSIIPQCYLYYLKILMEEMIIIMLIISGICKVNLWSFIYYFIGIYYFYTKKTFKKYYYLLIIVIFSHLVQTCFMLSNITEDIDPSQGNSKCKVCLLIIHKNLSIPWYEKIKITESMAFFLGLGVKANEDNGFILELLSIALIYFYLDLFAFSIYLPSHKETKTINYDKIIYNDLLMNNIEEMTLIDYENIRKTFRITVNYELEGFDQFKTLLHQQQEKLEKIKAKNIQRGISNDNLLQYEESSDIVKIFYLTSHNLVLTSILIIAMLASGFISLLYLIFTILLLLQSHSIIQGKQFHFFKFIKRILLLYIITEIFIQLIFQFPLINKHVTNDLNLLDCLGIKLLILFKDEITTNDFILQEKQQILVCIKAFTIVLINLQIIIYSSQGFKQFYFEYLIGLKQNIAKSSLINAYKYNNTLIEQMEKTIERRLSMYKTMDIVNDCLKDYYEKGFLMKNEFDKFIEEEDIPEEKEKDSEEDEEENINFQGDEFEEKVDEIKTMIRDIIEGTWLISIFNLLHKRYNNYLFFNENDTDYQNIRDGKKVKSEIEKMIDILLSEINFDYINKNTFLQVMTSLNKFKKSNSVLLQYIFIDVSEESELDRTTREEISKLKEILPLQGNLTKTEIINYFCKLQSRLYVTSKIIVQLAYLFITYFHYLCYFIMILNHIFCGSCLSLVYPLSIFFIAILENPRPKSYIWTFWIYYTVVLIFVKNLIQLPSLALIKGYAVFWNKVKENNIGLIYFEDTFSWEYFKYIVFDGVVIITLLIEKYFLIMQGLWDKRETEIEDIISGIKRVKNDSNDKKYFGLSNSYFTRLFPKIRNEKPGKDYYCLYGLMYVIIIIYFLLFYQEMVKEKFYKENLLTSRQITKPLLLYTLIQVGILIIDRILYLNQNKVNLKFEFFLKKRNELNISDEDYQQFTNEVKNSSEEIYKKRNQYEIFYIQQETFNYPIFFKYLLYMFLVFAAHFFFFIIFPLEGNFNLTNKRYFCTVTEDNRKCNDPEDNVYLLFGYLLYVFYLFFSALQIKHGFPDLRFRSLLKSEELLPFSNYLNLLYRKIPFFSEMKLLLDWSTTGTTLDIFQWNKYEQIYDVLFDTVYYMRRYNRKNVGRLITKGKKVTLGWSSFIILLVVLLCPLVIFSPLSPFNKLNNVTGAHARLYISFIHKGLDTNYTLWENEITRSYVGISEAVWKYNHYNNNPLTKQYDRDQIQEIKMSVGGDTPWNPSKPHFDLIISKLTNYSKMDDLLGIYLSLSYSFDRPYPSNTKESIKRIDHALYDKRDSNNITDHKDNITELINAMQNNTVGAGKNFTLDRFLSREIKLSLDPQPMVLEDESFQNCSIIFSIECGSVIENITQKFVRVYLQLENEDNLPPEMEADKNRLTFYTFSDKANHFMINYSVPTFYFTIILTIANFFKSYCSGQSQRVILSDMPEPEKLIALCEGIKVCRYTKNYEKEEKLYYILIEFLRSPEYLRYLSKSSIDFYNKRKTNYLES